METLCSRFYAVISGTSDDIDMGSLGECLGSKNWQFIFALNDLFRDLHLWPWRKASIFLVVNGGTHVDDLLDVESQKRFTAISILSHLASLWSGMSIWWGVIGISAKNLLHRVSVLTVVLLSEHVSVKIFSVYSYRAALPVRYIAFWCELWLVA